MEPISLSRCEVDGVSSVHCFHPLRAYRGSDGSVFFHESTSSPSVKQLELACGHCLGCRLERSRQWAIRCVHEASLHDQNCYLTLTYEEDRPSLEYGDFQRFMKRLRKHFAPRRVRFFMCGEYGELHARPHFHTCVFGVAFEDQVLFSTRDGVRLYSSPLLSRLWGHGFATVGAVTFQSAAYVARYILKKITGDAAVEHYRSVDSESGEIVERVPEFAHMSLKPGIGAGWMDKWYSDVFPHGQCVVGGVQVRTPKYYDRRFKRVDPDGYDRLVFEREQFARMRYYDNTDERLAVEETVVSARVSFLKRSL